MIVALVAWKCYARTLSTKNSVRETGRRYSVTHLFSHNLCHRGSDGGLWFEATNNELSLIYAPGTKGATVRYMISKDEDRAVLQMLAS